MIKQSIDQDIKSAMLSGDKRAANALRNIKSAILSGEIAAGKRDTGLSEEENISILQKEQKKRHEAVELYKQGGNKAQAEEEQYEVELIQKYLPAQLSEDQISNLIDEVIQAQGEVDMKAMGQIIGAVKQKAGGAADGATVARLVKDRLNK